MTPSEEAMKMRVLLTLFFSLAVLGASTATLGATKTTVLIFHPWSTTGLQKGFTIYHTVAGNCWEHSLSTDRPDAWRCMAGNSIYDPCFSGSPHNDEVACADEPFSKSVVIMTLKGKPKFGDMPIVNGLQPKGEPWAIQLTDGDKCSFSTGATDVADGERLNYECKGDKWLIGSTKRTTQPWTIGSIVFPDKKHVKQAAIAVAVF